MKKKILDIFEDWKASFPELNNIKFVNVITKDEIPQARFFKPFDPWIEIYIMGEETEESLKKALAHELGHFIHHSNDPNGFSNGTKLLIEYKAWSLGRKYIGQKCPNLLEGYDVENYMNIISTQSGELPEIHDDSKEKYNTEFLNYVKEIKENLPKLI